MKQRKIQKITTSPLHPGFLGKGHLASAIIDGNNYSETDPFMLLMDDRLDLPGGSPVGGPHPHAGFETVTLVLEGNEKEWKTGSLELMTAGKGIIHTEEITSKQKLRILQLWLVLPPGERWTEPFFQQILLEHVPTIKNEKLEIRVYSGSSNGLISPLQNHTPFTLADFKLEKNTEVKQQLPPSYNGFLYVIEGTIWVGEISIAKDQTGWLDIPDAAGESEITFRTREHDARFVLYAGKPHHVPVVHHGPFIGDSQEDIIRLYKEYRQNKMPHLNDLPGNRKLLHTGRLNYTTV